ncbi:MAG: hypothetical protein OEW50_06870 [Gammaproteobacteria bacterium]|jgi:hypothetical protein|nr:hypothetical protein [Gammaproteobacteria bacterium]MDH5176572.1 hypothetical protein [Gammaproteobacteria bacterium]MDH5227113.1 hypothetical protein [Gammaproteobacteria bacterium]
MTLTEAIEAATATGHAMDQAYQQVVFDELAIVSFRNQEVRLLWYKGPREDAFSARFVQETASLRGEARGRLFSGPYSPGEFEFVMAGLGSEVDAFIVLGEELYLVFGHTHKAMAEISKDPRWLAAQVFFVRLSERFQAQELTLAPEETGRLLTTY